MKTDGSHRLMLAPLAVSLTLVGCTAASGPKADLDPEGASGATLVTPVESPSGPGFDFDRSGPVEFLGYLAAREVLASARTDPTQVFASACWFDDSLQGWVRPEHLPQLAILLDSQTPCANVLKTSGSFIPHEPSTVGREAAFMIQGHMAEVLGGGYEGWPPGLRSELNPDLDALRAWAAEHGTD